MKEVDVLVVGAGAAGCFAAIVASSTFPDASVLILEKTNKILAKVKVSGGGRCNVTTTISDPIELSKNYPRGEKFLKKAFYQFSSKEMMQWLQSKGVDLTSYPNGCVFPSSNDSQTIIDCFLKELKMNSVPIAINQPVTNITKQQDGSFLVESNSTSYKAKSVIVTTGGQSKISGLDFLSSFNLKLVNPVPSLFTFNLPNQQASDLMGLSQENVRVRLEGEKWSSFGAVLFTHWGMSGPAILKSSAFGARILHEKEYDSAFYLNWTGCDNQQEVSEHIDRIKISNKLLVNFPLFQIKQRLWEFLIQRATISSTMKCSDLTTKHTNKLIETLTNDKYFLKGKTTFKEEFVTAGGIDLGQVNVQRMEVKEVPGLFFAGEVLDIDGVTGGFNFQAAWTTAFIAGKNALV